MFYFGQCFSIPHYSNVHTILPKMEQNRQTNWDRMGGNSWAEQSRKGKTWSRIHTGLVVGHIAHIMLLSTHASKTDIHDRRTKICHSLCLTEGGVALYNVV